RGLDIVKEMQDDQGKVKVEVIDDEYESILEVDSKLVAVAKEYGSKILTNDFNLNKVAQIEGLHVLNINDLANALKPAALPDERMEVKIVKQGKEAAQGVGYLDDGTMIVVDGGREHVGETVRVVVTSVLQTAAGRMIFTKLAGGA
ncbi:MAG: TRAM domain-containing protein, partial [Candidatus Hydrogenedentales bacterium]